MKLKDKLEKLFNNKKGKEAPVADSLTSSAVALDGAIDRLINRNRELEKENASLKAKKRPLKNSIDLNEKVAAFIDWYSENAVNAGYGVAYKKHQIAKMRDFIEKMAVWYEIRYPDYEINRLMPCQIQEEKEVSNVMFRENRYIRDLLASDSDVLDLDWDEFYNAHAFISSLPSTERSFMARAKLKCPNLKNGEARLQLDSDGIIKNAEMLSSLSLWLTDEERKTIDADFQGKSIIELMEFLEARASGDSTYKSLDEVTNANHVYQKEEMLNCVMYRIIERGGSGIGPRRAFLFAKEFGRNIDIPMMYGGDLNDTGLRIFINEYIKAGGSKDLECFLGYFDRTSEDEKLTTISIQELLLNKNDEKFYSPEEDELHQKLVNVLASQVDQDTLRKEEVVNLRLERKLKKGRNSNS